MEIQQAQLQYFIVKLTTLLRNLELDLLAQRAALASAGTNLEALSPEIEAAKSRPEIHGRIQEKYDIPLARFQATAQTLGLSKAAVEMLQEVEKLPRSN